MFNPDAARRTIPQHIGPASVLVVEDDPAAAQLMAVAMSEPFGVVRTAASGVEALLAMEAEPPDITFLDLQLPDVDGLELLVQVRQRWPEVPVILVTAADDIPTVVQAVQRGATNYLVKPVAPAVLVAAARKALEMRSLDRPLHCAIPEIIGIGPAMIQVRHQVTLASRCDVNVLLTGETGTGKELVARAIHRLSGTGGEPLIAHNCATTPSELFDSQFFGHCRGAFTGADRDHVGLLVRADGKFLLLDELESLGLAQQAKLLRVLDDGEVRPVGSGGSRQVSVRFIAATNRDPHEMIRNGTLREDLYYRLRGLEIRLPGLREHPEDIPPLAAHFLEGAAPRLSPEALERLCRFSWPGNVRQLRNVLAGALSSAGNGRIGVSHLSLDRLEPAAAEGGTHGSGERVVSRVRTIRDLERQAILQALGDFQGNRSRAALALGINRSTLRRKIHDLGIHVDD